MKAYKIELLIIDHDNCGDEIPNIIENARYPNRCINPMVKKVQSVEIGEWHDDHPLNKIDQIEVEYKRLFPN